MNKYILTTTLLISGCSPLQQAPLIYTSKQVLGIDISAPTTESAGISMNLGFKNIDAAYVPLAVSKAQEDGEKFAIEHIYATYGQGAADAPSVQQRSVSKLERELAEKNQELKLLQSTRHELLTKNQLQPLNKPLAEQVAEMVPLPHAITSNLKDKKSLSDEEKLQILAAVDDAIKIKEAAAAKNREEIINALKITQYDAMSVFGSFDSSTNGNNTEGVSHKLGKIFSTGVAAQNLTQGLQKYAVLEQCLDLIKNTTDQAQKNSLIAMCKTSIGEDK